MENTILSLSINIFIGFKLHKFKKIIMNQQFIILFWKSCSQKLHLSELDWKLCLVKHSQQSWRNWTCRHRLVHEVEFWGGWLHQVGNVSQNQDFHPYCWLRGKKNGKIDELLCWLNNWLLLWCHTYQTAIHHRTVWVMCVITQTAKQLNTAQFLLIGYSLRQIPPWLTKKGWRANNAVDTRHHFNNILLAFLVKVIFFDILYWNITLLHYLYKLWKRWKCNRSGLTSSHSWKIRHLHVNVHRFTTVEKEIFTTFT